jgi:hypothetical protein
MSIKSVSLLRCYFFIHVSVINDNHQGLQTIKCICVRYWTACRNRFLVLVVSSTSFYIGLVAYVLLWVKIGRFEFFIIGIVLNIMRVCVVNVDGFVLATFLVICAFRHPVVDSLVVFLFLVPYWYAFCMLEFCLCCCFLVLCWGAVLLLLIMWHCIWLCCCEWTHDWR